MDEDEEDDNRYEETVFFAGTCTCDHDEQEHDWGHCGKDDCPCEAGWEE